MLYRTIIYYTLLVLILLFRYVKSNFIFQFNSFLILLKSNIQLNRNKCKFSIYRNIIDDGSLDSVNINDLVDGSISRISQFIIKQNLDPLNLPQAEKKLWTVRNALID